MHESLKGVNQLRKQTNESKPKAPLVLHDSE
jgi:hypothetical protein